jgi:hypothetical protein
MTRRARELLLLALVGALYLWVGGALAWGALTAPEEPPRTRRWAGVEYSPEACYVNDAGALLCVSGLA